MIKTDYLVIGSGIAGLSFALKACKTNDVALVTKKKLFDSSTGKAQGGVACVTDKDDTFESHIQDTLIAGDGKGSIWASQGNDVMTGADTDTKLNGTTFYFLSGDGRDIITNFESYDVSRPEKSDVFSTYGQAITGIYLDGEDVCFRVGNDDDIVRITDMKNKVMAVNFVESLEGAQIGDSLNYDSFTKYYYGTSNSTLNVDIDNYNGDVQILLNGNDDGTYYLNDLNVVDASKTYKSALLAGNSKNNKFIASNGNSSLWGGNGGDDTLVGGEGYDTFFYGYGGGDDVIEGVNSNDLVRVYDINVSQITDLDVTTNNIKVTFNDGGKLNLNTENTSTQFMLDDENVYVLDQTTRTWTQK